MHPVYARSPTRVVLTPRMEEPLLPFQIGKHTFTQQSRQVITAMCCNSTYTKLQSVKRRIKRRIASGGRDDPRGLSLSQSYLQRWCASLG
jgi:hypothetical protein